MNESRLQLHGPISVRKPGRAPLVLAICLFAALLMFGMWQTGLLDDKRDVRQSATPPAPPSPVAPGEKPLVAGDPDQTSGVVTPTAAQPEATTTRDLPPIQVVVQAPEPPAAALYRQRIEEFQKQRAEAAVAALAAPMGTRVVRDAARSEAEADPSAPISSEDKGMSEHETFFSRSAARDEWSSPYARHAGRPYELKTGTVVPGVLLTGINSDLPGSIIGQVSQNVFDSATGRWLLIPKGARLYGVYDSRVAMGQRRVLIAWNRIVFPDGSAITLGAMPGASPDGTAGFQDQVDNHYMRIFGNGVLMSLISGGMAWSMDRLDNSGGTNEKPSLQNEMGSALAAQMGQASMSLLQRNASISPTLNIRSGYTFTLVLTKDVAFEAPYGN